ncbi:MAG: ornithine--oxo-acid transaminase [bacterium]|uniref:ornithine aminotransferase n=2 Tax=Bacteria candidate phyla TaxID=1783234 RepID=A0A101I3Z2_UNCT6|nr:MAG: Acetylornithine aminotransferase [candidate division TA06 bacterium 32_111]KUK88099.1 MAG: Acetylornithine aminotransferase [candidate division TA06 bacterium 34_109]MDI6700900.1 ornithine--oxo-acid transaminase [bacterium]HAF07029.1 ornithine--oxo-acid transaminase [candidate division WOR-3 bacterium]HCP16944.1 ornithine--oxo-acid transaminase [candidate division WOR-3 bacterium]
MKKSNKLFEMEKKYGANNYHPLDVCLAKGKGIWVWDTEGKKYLDFLSSYSAVNQGHCNPKIAQAAIKQMKKLTLTSRAFHNDQLPLFYEKLCKLAKMDKMLPMNSGAEAVETALKAIRKWGYTVKGVEKDKAEIIVSKNNFHGRTITIISFSSEFQYKDGFGPLTQGFVEIPFGDTDALEKAITPNTVAFLTEPIQGEGGIIIPPDGFLKRAQEICRKNNILFVLDEIQTGLCRTGKLFAHLWEEGVKPDGLILGKALSGGYYPVSAFLAKKEVMDVFKPGDHGSTFGGNPLASAIAVASLDVLIKEKLDKNSLKMGNYFMKLLKSIKSDYIKEVRGRGLLIGVELNENAGGARRFCEALMKEGLLCKETHENIIRFAPPLVITKKDIDWAFKRIEKVFKTI